MLSPHNIPLDTDDEKRTSAASSSAGDSTVKRENLMESASTAAESTHRVSDVDSVRVLVFCSPVLFLFPYFLQLDSSQQSPAAQILLYAMETRQLHILRHFLQSRYINRTLIFSHSVD